ncbi:hypothetical protein DpV83gp029 [Deerpox virus W-848-83]|uniref:Uncharacterized protein n=1 Tax=Deerpox virus (strain Mule deer/United States/W-848-83/1983) TaxID=305674 RepID=Q08FX1_DPV83|nr:hypothetical protein DpV83gp029 [Deerpox virus W-848-83]ABI99186.1 hypothetical protein DpV83gp029 [Deerpox virus W-848-83]
MSDKNRARKINKVIVSGKPYNTPTKDEIKKYGCCLNIKKPIQTNDNSIKSVYFLKKLITKLYINQ